MQTNIYYFTKSLHYAHKNFIADNAESAPNIINTPKNLYNQYIIIPLGKNCINNTD